MNAVAGSIVAGLAEFAGHVLVMSLQATLLATLIYAMTRPWKSGAACFKYGLWCLVIAKFLIPVGFSLPVGAVNLLPDVPRIGATAAWSADAGSIAGAPRPIDAPPGRSPGFNIRLTAQECVGGVWLAGFMFFMTSIVIRHRRLSRLILRSGVRPPEWVVEKSDSLSALIGLRRSIPVLFSESVDTPLVIGILRPHIVMPGGLFVNLSENEQSSLILHELVHVKRLDHSVIVLEWIACAVHFFNPVAWWSVRRLRAEREMACDDAVVTLLKGSANDYSNGLVKVVHYQLQNASACVMGKALTLSERGSEIGGRIRRILDPFNQRKIARLTLPGILMLVLISCVVMPTRSGWRAGREQAQKEAVAAVLALGGEVMYDFQRPNPNQPNVFDPNAVPGDPNAFHRVVRVGLRDTRVTDADLALLDKLPDVENLDLTNTSVTGAGLIHVRGLKKLAYLGLWNTQVDDEGLKNIQHLTKMWGLVLDNTKVTDAGMVHLKGLTNLTEWLGLTDTRITDKGLKHLTRLKKLRSLNLRRTQVTPAGVKELQRALPATDISFGP
ncbi:hypothetical protein LLG95_09710 [bacterium]|nr:hypothetical protein [bacterium]